MNFASSVRDAISNAKFRAETAWYNGSFSPESAVEHVFSWKSVSPWQAPNELLELAKIVQARRPKRMLEIGSAKGGTLFVWCQMADPEATVVSVDLPGGDFGRGYAAGRVPLMRRFRQSGQKLHLLQTDSHDSETLLRIKKIFGNTSIDFLFIDGDHTYDGVKQDFDMYSTLVAKGGIIGFHDIVEAPAVTAGEVSQFWNDIKPGFRHREIVADKVPAGYGIGLLFV
jgi:cephalosporin hydroxylase